MVAIHSLASELCQYNRTYSILFSSSFHVRCNVGCCGGVVMVFLCRSSTLLIFLALFFLRYIQV